MAQAPCSALLPSRATRRHNLQTLSILHRTLIPVQSPYRLRARLPSQPPRATQCLLAICPLKQRKHLKPQTIPTTKRRLPFQAPNPQAAAPPPEQRHSLHPTSLQIPPTQRVSRAHNHHTHTTHNPQSCILNPLTPKSKPCHILGP